MFQSDWSEQWSEPERRYSTRPRQRQDHDDQRSRRLSSPNVYHYSSQPNTRNRSDRVRRRYSDDFDNHSLDGHDISDDSDLEGMMQNELDQLRQQFRRQNSHRHRQVDSMDSYYDSEPDFSIRGSSNVDDDNDDDDAPELDSSSDHGISDQDDIWPRRRSVADIRGQYLQVHAHTSRTRSLNSSPQRDQRGRAYQHIEIDANSSRYDNSDDYSVEVERRTRWRSPQPGSLLLDGQYRELNPEYWIYKDGTYINSWRENRVVFRKNEDTMYPDTWLGKLETLQAQVLDGSSMRRYPRMMGTLHTADFYQHIEDYLSVLKGVGRNLAKMQHANACRESFNLLVLEANRHYVARLVGVKVVQLAELAKLFTTVLQRSGPSFTIAAQGLLEGCEALLRRLGLLSPAFSDHHRHHLIEDGWFAHVPSGDRLKTSVLYTARAVVFVLELSSISFCGAHLDRFDDIYFHNTSESYHLPCDDRDRFIKMERRSLDCLAGFHHRNTVWVFSMDDGSVLPVRHESLYLSTTPEEFAEVWGPMWRSVSPHDHRVTLHFRVAPGYIVPWQRSHRSIVPREGEVLCHWTDHLHETESVDAYRVIGPIGRLLIGARRRLLQDRLCAASFNARDYFNKMNNRQLLDAPGTLPSKRSFDFDNIQVGFSSSLAPVAPTALASWKVNTRSGTPCADRFCTEVSIRPSYVISFLKSLYGIEISACTGNARRVTLAQLLSSATMKELLPSNSVHWSTQTRESYFRAIASADGDQVERLLFDSDSRTSNAITLAIQWTFEALRHCRVVDKDIYALWAHDGRGHQVRIPLSEHKWASLLQDNGRDCALFLVNRTCLQCADTVIEAHSPTYGLGTATVFETTVCINENAYVPKPLRGILPPQAIDPARVLSLRKGDVLRIRGDSRIEIVKVLPGGEGVFVRVISSAFPSFKGSKLRRLFQKEKGEYDYSHTERIQPEQMSSPYLRVFVMSHRHEIAEWLPVANPLYSTRRMIRSGSAGILE